MGWKAVSCTIALLIFLTGTAAADDGHFGLTFKGCPDRSSPGLSDTLESSYSEINTALGSCPAHVEVVVISDDAMDRVGKQVDSFSGWNHEFSAVILRNSSLQNRTMFPMLVRHELAHLALNEILSKKDPSEFHWMEEGVCTLVSREPLGDGDVSRYIADHGFLDTAGIYDAIKSEDCAISKNGYMQSYSLVKYVERRFGPDAVKKILACPEDSLEDAFLRCTGESFGSFYDDWKAGIVASN